MPLSRALRSLSLLAILAGASASAWALPQPQGRAPVPDPQRGRAQTQQKGSADAREHERRADQRALSDAVRRAERATRGQVLSAERVQFDGRDVNRVKVVDDRGRVRVYWDDPQTEDDEAGDRPDPRRRTRDEDDDSD